MSKCSKNVWILLDSLFLSCRVERYDGNCSIVGLCLLNIYSNVFVLRCDVGSIGKEVEGGGVFGFLNDREMNLVTLCDLAPAITPNSHHSFSSTISISTP